MKMLLTTTMSCALIGLLFTVGTTNVATASAKSKGSISYECFTNDGYGRKLPCSYGYRRQKHAEQNPYDCFTDDGYGRKLPCSYRFKR